MACREEITLFCDIQGTLIGSIDLADVCKVDTTMDGTPTTTVTIPYSLRTNWRTLLAERVMEDLVDFERLFVAEKEMLVSRLTNNGTADTCGRPTTFHRKMKASINDNATFRVLLRLLLANMMALGLNYRVNLTPPIMFDTTVTPTRTSTLAQHSVAPPPTPNNIDV
jgi:hypothetical protein